MTTADQRASASGIPARIAGRNRRGTLNRLLDNVDGALIDSDLRIRQFISTATAYSLAAIGLCRTDTSGWLGPTAHEYALGPHQIEARRMTLLIDELLRSPSQRGRRSSRDLITADLVIACGE